MPLAAGMKSLQRFIGRVRCGRAVAIRRVKSRPTILITAMPRLPRRSHTMNLLTSATRPHLAGAMRKTRDVIGGVMTVNLQNADDFHTIIREALRAIGGDPLMIAEAMGRETAIIATAVHLAGALMTRWGATDSVEVVAINTISLLAEGATHGTDLRGVAVIMAVTREVGEVATAKRGDTAAAIDASPMKRNARIAPVPLGLEGRPTGVLRSGKAVFRVRIATFLADATIGDDAKVVLMRAATTERLGEDVMRNMMRPVGRVLRLWQSAPRNAAQPKKSSLKCPKRLTPTNQCA